MLTKIWPIPLLIGVALSPVAARAQAAPAFKSVTVDLPAGDQVFLGGTAADSVNNNCLACHSADMVLNQPALSKAQWEAQVNLMRTAYKAPMDSKDAGAIVDYLARVKGVK